MCVCVCVCVCVCRVVCVCVCVCVCVWRVDAGSAFLDLLYEERGQGQINGKNRVLSDLGPWCARILDELWN